MASSLDVLNTRLKMHVWAVSLVLFVLPPSSPSSDSILRFPTNRNADRYTNMVVNGADTIIVAENGLVNILDLNLTSVKKFSTCRGDSCENINKFLSVFGDNLILCGTGNDGICQVWDGNKFIYNSSTDVTRGNYLQVSTDQDIPAKGFVVGEDLFLGNTYGPGVVTTNDRPHRFISRRDVKQSFTFKSHVELQDSERYFVYFRTVFKHGDFIYFLTNQKFKTNTTGFISKLIRICLSEKSSQDPLPIKSYTDVPISCNVNGVDYTLLIDAEFLPSTNMLVATFSKGDDPQNPQPGSAICVYMMDDMNTTIQQAKENFIECPLDNDHSYLDIDLHKCLSPVAYNDLKDDYICPTNGRGTKVIGNVTLHPTTAYKVQTSDVTVTTVRGFEIYGMYADIYLGTDKGTINKATLFNDTVFEYEKDMVLDRGHSILAIEVIRDYIYGLTNRKVSRIQKTECSIYKICSETMAGRNPSCGWCVGENKCTKRDNCSNTWLSSLTECISIDVSPKYLQASIKAVNITIHTPRLPSNFTASLLECEYHIGAVQQGAPEHVASINNSGFYECSYPGNAEHTDVTLSLKYTANSNTFSLAETTLHVYNCTEYKSCGQCAASSEIKCDWCTASLTCRVEGTCGGEVVNKGNHSWCPELLRNSDLYISSGESKIIELHARNLVQNIDYICVLHLPGQQFKTNASVTNDKLACNLNVSFENDSAKQEFPISVIQKAATTEMKLEEAEQSLVTIYKCDQLAQDCTNCKALNSTRYSCNWCQDGSCKPSSVCAADVTCPAPKITGVMPTAVGFNGRTTITVTGTDFGTDKAGIKHFTMKSLKNDASHKLTCSSDITVNQKDSQDFGPVNENIECNIGITSQNASDLSGSKAVINFDYNGKQAKPGYFNFVTPEITSIKPEFGPMAGGTLLNIMGNNFQIGNKLNRLRLGSVSCDHPLQFTNEITCITRSVPQPIVITSIFFTYDGETYEIKDQTFIYKESPVVTGISGSDEEFLKTIESGGTTIELEGEHFENAETISVKASYAGNEKDGNCTVIKDDNKEKFRCVLPAAPDTVAAEIEENKDSDSDSESTSGGSVTAKLTIKMDGYEKKYDLKYYRNPKFDMASTTVFSTSSSQLVLQGNYLTLVATSGDYKVAIGLHDQCLEIKVTATNLTCYLPNKKVDASEDYNVTISVGNYHHVVGVVRYDPISTATLQNILIIVLPIAGGLLLIGLIAGFIGTFKYRRVKGTAKKLEKNIQDIELQIKKVFRQEFLDMHTTMSRVNESLIEKGFPYNSYQRYSFLMMFPGEWNMEEHPLMHEPVVSKRKVSDGIRLKLKKGMETFENLLQNKFFLVSVISTMEKQKKFFLKEKSNMAGHLSVALMGRMEYFHEILEKLLDTLVDETPSKSQKTLFRRCESITEKLLSNWLVLSLYPHVKMHSGSPLYMLLKGTQLTMESGPIDALTEDSKYTLSEDKLLKQDDKPNTLTLKLMVENCDEIRDCKVLDCDTISQVKAKCLSQIYVNFPASQLTVDPAELNLEWHWGSGGRLVIKDEDPSSKREGEWLRLNTLSHYNVHDGSSMALVDPNSMGDQEDYVNLAQIKFDTDPGCNGSTHSNEPLTLPDEENGLPITRWHLVKPDIEQSKPGSVVVDELYLNRLITTKQSVLEYVKNLFDTILSSSIPPPAKFLFDLLDKSGERNKVDTETIHAWKSQCYTIRFWATLINKPYNLFDQRIPYYVETSMQVISQVLIESCSLKAHQYTKDSSPGKLIFKNDMMNYRDKVKEYYDQVRDYDLAPEDFRQYLLDLNGFQKQQCTFNKHAALYSLYSQLKSYMDEIMEDLENNADAKALHLDRKLANLNDSMSDD